jgi:hypothetical protein
MKKLIKRQKGVKPPADLDVDYRDGARGMIAWCNDLVYVPIYKPGELVSSWCRLGDLPVEAANETGKSYRYIWEEQQEVLKEALRMRNGRFVYRLIVLCWMRGEGKSLLACLIQLWKFFNFPRQQIMLGANSKDQVKFVHFDIMRDIIQNSPDLLWLIGGKKNLQEKEIRIKDKDGMVRSLIRSISSFSGIVSNITGYTFSEIFDMKKPKFFTQLDGSIRNIPNALGVIDSTVSEKTHILYHLYSNWLSGDTTTVYFSYRFSRNGDLDDYWNPNMTTEQLDDYRVKFPLGDFERYFLNVWSAGAIQLFTEEMVDEMGIIGVNGEMLNHEAIKSVCTEKTETKRMLEDMISKGLTPQRLVLKLDELKARERRIDAVFNFGTRHPELPNLHKLNQLGEMLDTDWAVLAGIDFSDILAMEGTAKTILSIVLKGLPGSKTDPYYYSRQGLTPRYLYVLFYMLHVENNSVEDMKQILEDADAEFDGVDVLCSERYGAWDMVKWCEDHEVKFEAVSPTYVRQKASFTELYNAAKEGRYKCPKVPIVGMKQNDLHREEFSAFQHLTAKKWFGSREKAEKKGIQDDSIYSVNWAIWGGRELGVEDFRMRQNRFDFGILLQNRDLLGRYGRKA